MVWQVRVEILDAGGGVVRDATLQLSTRRGADFSTQPPTTVSGSFDLAIDDDVLGIVVAVNHPRCAPLVVNLVREPGELHWRWTEPQVQVATTGRQVTVRAVLPRARLASLTASITAADENELVRRATAVKAPLDAAAARHKPPNPPAAVRIATVGGMLRTGNSYRNSGAPAERSYHILTAEPLGDVSQTDWPDAAVGWGRFATSVHPVSPSRAGRLHMFEYGEIVAQPTAPRLLVAVWVPPQFTKAGVSKIDYIVWLTPNTNPPTYPRVEFPFRGDYPYTLMALGTGTRQHPYTANQTYSELGFAHMFGSHKLAYQLEAAEKAAALVVPIAPSSHFELWESPVTLMRMLKELCRAIPRDDDGRIPKQHAPPPAVGRVAVAGFSAAGRRLATLLNSPGAASYYRDPLWGTEADRRDFERAWCELWCIDGNFGSEHAAFLNNGARWVQQRNDRQLRIYKNEFTDGRWDPRSQGGAFGAAMRGANYVERGRGSHWALHGSGLHGRIQALSLTKSWTSGPSGPGTQPPWNEEGRPHESMPVITFGHAAVTSGFSRLTN